MYSSSDYGPNGVTLAYGRVYGVTATGVFALDAATGHQVWYDTSFAGGRAKFDIAPQVANHRVFVASALTAGGGLIYALDAGTGRSEEHTSELQSHLNLVCRLLLEKKKSI